MAAAVVGRGTARLRAVLDGLVREHASPLRLGVAVGVGVLLGCSPFLGFQLLLGFALGWLLHLNRLAIVLGIQVSIPPLTPLVLFVTAQTGARVLHGQWLPLHLSAFQGVPARTWVARLFLDMLVGGALVGGALALLFGALTALGVQRRRGRALLAERT